MPKLEVPEISHIPEIKGVFVGGCVDRGDGSRFRRRAHAHTSECTNPGWICFLSIKRIYNPHTRKIDDTLLHEVAHILTDQGHTLKWGRCFRDLAHQFGIKYQISRDYRWKRLLNKK